LAECARLQGKPEAGVAAAERAIALVPQDGEYYGLAAALLGALARWQEAEHVGGASRLPEAAPAIEQDFGAEPVEAEAMAKALDGARGGRGGARSSRRFSPAQGRGARGPLPAADAWESVLSAERLAPADPPVARLKARLAAVRVVSGAKSPP
jgi:hypothetical protein